MYEFILPDLGEGIHEGEVLKWHVEPGNTIVEDEPLVEIETDKAAVTIPSPRGGKVISTTGKVGDLVNVGEIIVVIDDGSGAAAAPAIKSAEKAPTKPTPARTPVQPAVAPVTGRPVPAAPATRRLARELGLDINTVPASGPGGRVTFDDVKNVAEGKPSAVPSGTPAEQAAKTPTAPEAEFAAHAASTIPLLDIEPLPDFSKWDRWKKSNCARSAARWRARW